MYDINGRERQQVISSLSYMTFRFHLFEYDIYSSAASIQIQERKDTKDYNSNGTKKKWSPNRHVVADLGGSIGAMEISLCTLYI